MIFNLNTVNTLPAYFKLKNKFNDEIIKSVSDYLYIFTFNDIITIDDFQKTFNLSREDTIELLDILCELKILSKYSHVHLCPLCGSINYIINTPAITVNNFKCRSCEHSYISEDICSTSVYYMLRKSNDSSIKLFYVTWNEKIRNDNDDIKTTTTSLHVFGYTEADAESVVHEYYHPVGPIEVIEVEMENKRIIK